MYFDIQNNFGSPQEIVESKLLCIRSIRKMCKKYSFFKSQQDDYKRFKLIS